MPFTPQSSQVVPVLVISANPLDTSRLAQDEELRAIRDALESRPESITTCFRPAARPEDVVEALVEDNPLVVHFSAHCTDSGELILVDDHGDSVHVSPSTLSRVFGQRASIVDLVVLNGCCTSIPAEAIVENVPCVIATRSSINDDVAMRFARELYRRLARGDSVRDSFDTSCSVLGFYPSEDDEPYVLLEGENDLARRSYLVSSARHSRASVTSGRLLLAAFLMLSLVIWLLGRDVTPASQESQRPDPVESIPLATAEGEDVPSGDHQPDPGPQDAGPLVVEMASEQEVSESSKTYESALEELRAARVRKILTEAEYREKRKELLDDYMSRRLVTK